MNEVIYFNELKDKYNCDIKLCTSEIDKEQLDKIPEIMRVLYILLTVRICPMGEILV